MSMHRRTRLLGGTLVTIAMALVAMTPTGQATAQKDASRTLIILAAVCPAGFSGTPSAGECDDIPASDAVFHVGRPMSDLYIEGTTDEAGMVAFDIADLPYRGEIRIIQELSRPARAVARCVDAAGSPLSLFYEDFPESDPPVAVARVSVGDEGDSHCDWYTMPGASPRDEGTPSASGTPARADQSAATAVATP